MTVNIDINRMDSLNKAAQTLKRHGILIFPTDTVYGIGCPTDVNAIKRLYKIKNRPLTQPTSVLLTKKLYYKNRSSDKCGIEIPLNMEAEYGKGFF